MLDETAIPIHSDAHEMSRIDGVSALDHALYDGEDFELCVVVPAADAARLLADPPARSQAVPDRRNYRGAWGQASFSRRGELRPISPRGFDHFRPRH